MRTEIKLTIILFQVHVVLVNRRAQNHNGLIRSLAPQTLKMCFISQEIKIHIFFKTSVTW